MDLIQVPQEVYLYTNESNWVVGSYLVVRCLSSDSFSKMYLAENNKKLFAIKTYDEQKIEENPVLKELINNEMLALNKLHHPNVMKMVDSFRTNTKIYLVFPYFEGGNLLNSIETNGWLTEEQVLHFLPQLVDAFQQAQSLKIIHRDIKLETLFLDNDQVVVGSFGLASVGRDIESLFAGTRSFMAPEMVQNHEYSYGIDMWSLGVTLYMSMFSHNPWKNISYSRPQPGGKLQLVSSTGFDVRINNSNTGANLFYPPGARVSDFLKKIFCSMLQFDPKQRIGWSDLAIMLKARPLQFELMEGCIQKAKNPSENKEKNIPKTEKLKGEQENMNSVKLTLHTIADCLKKINEAKTNLNLEKAGTIDQMLDNYVNEKQPSPSSDKNGPEHSTRELKREVVENYIEFQYHTCLQAEVIIQKLLKAVDQGHGLEQYRGVLYIAVNIISKKITNIAEYFNFKLKSRCSVFTQIGKCPEFYQNGFANQYLASFKLIKERFEEIIKKSAVEAKKHLKTNFYRREEHLLWANQIDKFDEEVTEGLFYATFMIIEGVETADADSQKKMKELVSNLSLICRYKDCIKFQEDIDEQQMVIDQEVEAQLDLSNLDSNFEQNKEYFRKWKAGLKTN